MAANNRNEAVGKQTDTMIDTTTTMSTNVNSMTPADWRLKAARVREVASKCADATYLELNRYALALDHVARRGARDKFGTLLAAYSALSPYAQIYVDHC